MSVRAFVGSYWRIILLVALVAVSVYALFVPGGMLVDDGPPTDGEVADEIEADDGLTNLVFGLGLDGGARISAPPTGMMVENLDREVAGDERSENDIRDALVDDLDVDPANVSVRYDSRTDSFTAELFTDDVAHEDFADALSGLDYDVTADDVEEGVTEETRDEMVTVIESKINEAGLAGGRAYSSEALGGQHFVVTEVPAMTSVELRELLEERGVVEIVAYYPDPDGDGQVNETVLESDDFTDIDAAEYDDDRGQWVVPVRVTEDRAWEYQERMNEIGFTTEGTEQCGVRVHERGDADFDTGQDDWCLLTVADGEIVAAHSMGDTGRHGGPGLATDMREGTWAQNPTFTMTSQEQTDAHSLSVNLRAGTMPAPLDFGEAQVFSVEPALAEQFKGYSLFIGILAILAVSGMVYLRYSDVRVAAPMIVTALAEVIILLGFAAAIRMPLDLAHVAGFIAVVGTGVDDLIIIADEVMDEGDVSQRRVFDSRFRKAFWVIGAAAATTIIAMSPLAVLSLGDLQGFAIVTILGVLIGVFVTRPAYGDILRKLMTDK